MELFISLIDRLSIRSIVKDRSSDVVLLYIYRLNHGGECLVNDLVDITVYVLQSIDDLLLKDGSRRGEPLELLFIGVLYQHICFIDFSINPTNCLVS